MKIKKDKFKKYFAELNSNQIISYNPSDDSYIIVTSINDQVVTTVISNDLLDKLYNLSWEDDNEGLYASSDALIACDKDSSELCSESCLE